MERKFKVTTELDFYISNREWNDYLKELKFLKKYMEDDNGANYFNIMPNEVFTWNEAYQIDSFVKDNDMGYYEENYFNFTFIFQEIPESSLAEEIMKLILEDYEVFKNVFYTCDSKFADGSENATGKDIVHHENYYLVHNDDMIDFNDDEYFDFGYYQEQNYAYWKLTKEQYEYLKEMEKEND